MRYELTDYEWAAIKPMLPNKPRGVPRVNDRRVLNGDRMRSRRAFMNLIGATAPFVLVTAPDMAASVSASPDDRRHRR
jgi:transposase